MQVPGEPYCVSCARPTPMPPPLGGASPSTQPLPPLGYGKGEKTVRLPAGSRRWRRGCGSVAASSLRAWLLRRVGTSPTARKFLAELVNLETDFWERQLKSADPFSAHTQQSCLRWAYRNTTLLLLHLIFCFPLEPTFFSLLLHEVSLQFNESFKIPIVVFNDFPRASSLPFLPLLLLLIISVFSFGVSDSYLLQKPLLP